MGLSAFIFLGGHKKKTKPHQSKTNHRKAPNPLKVLFVLEQAL